MAGSGRSGKSKSAATNTSLAVPGVIGLANGQPSGGTAARNCAAGGQRVTSVGCRSGQILLFLRAHHVPKHFNYKRVA